MSAEPALGLLLDAAGIQARIPHAGPMALLDRLLEAREEGLSCESDTHRRPDHPLRTASGLLAPAAIEYAAQAMALHGALLQEARSRATGEPQVPTPGFLASVRQVHFHVARLDTIEGPLKVEAWRLAGEGDQILYRFALHGGGQPVAEGRAAVVLNTPLSAEPAP